MKLKWLLLGCMCMFAMMRVYALKIVNVTVPGTLTTMLAQAEKDTVTSIIVTGVINSADILVLGKDMKSLAHVDMSQATNIDKKFERFAFSSKYSLKSIHLPQGDTIITSFAFQGCTALQYVAMSPAVTTIGAQAFSRCSALTSIDISPATTIIGNNCFSDCSSLVSIDLPPGLATIGGGAFRGCTVLQSLAIPASVVSIGDAAFSDCQNLNALSLPPRITTIAASLCKNCVKLTSLYVPQAITSIGKNAFDGCKELRKLNLPTTVTSLGDYAFQGCSGLNEFYIPPTVSAIGNYCFKGCSLIRSISIPQTISVISDYLFQDCTSLEDVSLPQSITSIGLYAFANCSSLTSVVIPPQVNNIMNYSFYNCIKLATVDFPATLIAIGNSAFANCSTMTSITIPSSVTSIGNTAFLNCASVKTIVIPSSVSIIAGGGLSSPSVKEIYSFRASNLNTAYSGAFENVDKSTCVLYVPRGAKQFYVTAEEWRLFKNIVEMQGLHVSRDSIVLSSKAGSKATVDIVSDGTFVIQSNQAWLTVSASNTLLTMTASENTSSSREALVTIVINGHVSKTITVTQERSTLIPLLEVQFRNRTIENMTTYVLCNYIKNATEYEWQLTDHKELKTRSFVTMQNWFIPGEEALHFDTEYSVSVHAKVDSVWQPYSVAYTITTPAAPRTMLSASYRGATLRSMDQLFYAQYKTGATQYEFEFTELKTGKVLTKLNKNHALAMKSVAGTTLATTYSVRVRPLYYKSVGEFGPAFNLTTPTVIPTTALKTVWRGVTISSLSTFIWGTEVQGATNYEWQFVESGTTDTLTRMSGKAYNVMKLKMVPGIEAGKTYSVRIRAMVGTKTGEWGAAYTITTAPVMTKSAEDEEAIVGDNLTTDNALVSYPSEAKVILYPTIATRMVTIEAPVADGGYMVTIVNAGGRIVATLPMNELTMSIDITGLGFGKYFVLLTKGGKVVKQLEFVKE